MTLASVMRVVQSQCGLSSVYNARHQSPYAGPCSHIVTLNCPVQKTGVQMRTPCTHMHTQPCTRSTVDTSLQGLPSTEIHVMASTRFPLTLLIKTNSEMV